LGLVEQRERVPGAKAQILRGFYVRAEARTYLRSKSNGKVCRSKGSGEVHRGMSSGNFYRQFRLFGQILREAVEQFLLGFGDGLCAERGDIGRRPRLLDSPLGLGSKERTIAGRLRIVFGNGRGNARAGIA